MKRVTARIGGVFVVIILLLITSTTNAGVVEEQVYARVSDSSVLIWAKFSKDQKQDDGMVAKIIRWSMVSGFVFEYQNEKMVLSAGHFVPEEMNAQNMTLAIAYFKPGSRPPQDLEFVGLDNMLDISLFKFKTPEAVKKCPVAKLGSSKSLKIGQTVIAIGSPSPFRLLCTSGIVGELAPWMRSGITRPELIIFDAKINGGSSGSFLLNSQGEVVGVNLMVISPSLSDYSDAGTIARTNNFSAATPIDDVKFVLPFLYKGGEIKHPPLHIEFQYTTEFHATDFTGTGFNPPAVNGLMIIAIMPETFAADVLREGDVVISCDGVPVSDLSELYRIFLLGTDLDKVFTLKINRDGQEFIVKFTLKNIPKPPAMKDPPGQNSQNPTP